MTANINITDLIALLTGQRKEAFAFEKHIALMTFAAWLHYPNDQDVLRYAQAVAAAACYVHSGGKSNRHATVEKLSVALIAPPLSRPIGRVSDSSVTLSTAAMDIVSFFLRCPSEKKPSLNKAFFFIEQGGADYPDERDGAKDARSTATLKVAWKTYASASPFLWSSAAITKMDRLFEMLPDEYRAFKHAETMLRDSKMLIKYFGVSKYVQECLLSKIDATSRRRFDVKFPKGLLSEECALRPFAKQELELLAKYRAPTPSY